MSPQKGPRARRRRRTPMHPRGHRKSLAFVSLCILRGKTSDMISYFLKLTHLYHCSSAFFVFCSDHRPKIKEDNPGISIGDIAKKLGEMWATQTTKDKAPYAAKAAKLKEKYEKVSTCRPHLLYCAR